MKLSGQPPRGSSGGGESSASAGLECRSDLARSGKEQAIVVAQVFEGSAMGQQKSNDETLMTQVL
jgi:hypothetical protein